MDMTWIWHIAKRYTWCCNIHAISMSYLWDDIKWGFMDGYGVPDVVQLVQFIQFHWCWTISRPISNRFSINVLNNFECYIEQYMHLNCSPNILHWQFAHDISQYCNQYCRQYCSILLITLYIQLLNIKLCAILCTILLITLYTLLKLNYYYWVTIRCINCSKLYKIARHCTPNWSHLQMALPVPGWLGPAALGGPARAS